MIDWAPPQLPIVLLDVDGVLADFTGHWLMYANDVLGTKYTRYDITAHDIEDCLGLSKEDRNAVREYIDHKRMARRLNPLPGAIEGVKELAKSAEVFFVTSSLTSSETWENDRRSWLRNYFGNGWDKRACFIKHKYLVSGDVFVDDSPEHVEKWAKFNRGNNSSAVLWKQWYNNGASFHDSVDIVQTSKWEKIQQLAWEKTTTSLGQDI